MAVLDHYRILGVKPDCTLEEVRRRYRLLARQHHPDLNPDDPEAAGRFRLIAAAFEAIQAARAQARAKGRSLRSAANYRHGWFPPVMVAGGRFPL
jgi:DnaJ-class molecular chaperone